MVKSSDTKIEICSLTDYMRFIESTCEDEYILFRGQREDWSLQPKIARIIPKGPTSILNAEMKMLEDFKRLAKPFLRTTPRNDWEWIAIAQHHGMATRLLDWSTNPLAALWFAVNCPPTANYGVVWKFNVPETDIIQLKDVKKESPFDVTVTKVFQPELSTKRIQSQNGWFTVHKYLSDKQRFIKFETHKTYKRYLTKVIIRSQHFFTLRYQLDRMGVNRLSLFADLDGAAVHSEWMNSLLTDEQTKPTINDSYSPF